MGKTMKEKINNQIMKMFMILIYLCCGCSDKNVETYDNRVKPIQQVKTIRDIKPDVIVTSEITRIYQDSSKESVLFDTQKVIGDTLVHCPEDSLIDVQAVSEKKVWAILYLLPKEVGPGRVDQINKLYYVPLKMEVPRSFYKFHLSSFHKIGGEEYLYFDEEDNIKISTLKQKIEDLISKK